MKVLFVVPYVPSLVRVRPYNLVRGLAARGVDVTIATLWSTAAEQGGVAALGDLGIRTVAAHLSRWRSVWNCLRVLPTTTPFQAAFCWHPALAQQADVALHNGSFDVIHVEHLRGARYGLHLKQSVGGHGSAPPIVWDSVDCISHLFEQAVHESRSVAGRWRTRLELGRTRDYEGWLVSQFDRVLVTSEVDRQALMALPSCPRDGGSRTTVLPNGVDLGYFGPDRAVRDQGTVVLTGKMSYHANVTAALHLVEDIMPHVWAQRPDVRVAIVGKDPSSEVRALPRVEPRVSVTGTVPDIGPYLASATVATAPVPYGAGIQNKVLEAMACATPVVATPQAVAALHVESGVHLLVGDGPVAFADAVLRLLGCADLRDRIGRRGRRYVERHHDWAAVAGQLEDVYRETISGHHDRRQTASRISTGSTRRAS